MTRTTSKAGTEARERRSHAERSAETRARIIDAVVECIADLGYQRTTANEIAARAGVTWGAVQHHFGGKDGILVAVLEDSFARFAVLFEGLGPHSASLEERTSRFIDLAWKHFGSSSYQSTFQILINHAPESARSEESAPVWQSRMFRSWNEVWLRVFADCELPAEDQRVLSQYVVSSLTGMAAMAMLRPAAGSQPPPELVLLKRSLLRGLQKG